jgi:dUTP pyrophosphatase
MTQPALQVTLLSSKAKAPTRGSAFAAGYDLYSTTDVVIKAHDRAVVPTDIAIAVPPGTYGRIAPRSGLAVKHGIQTGAGVIDADYRGEVRVLLFNHSNEDYKIESGDRICQLVLESIINPPIEVVEALDDTERGQGGFGSTGKK